MSRKRVVLLGSTGSIGENAVRVVQALPDRFEVVGLSTRANGARLLQQARELGVGRVAVTELSAAAALAAHEGLHVHEGPAGLTELVAATQPDLVLCAVVGAAGLPPVLEAVQAGVPVALATKEVLVMAGHLVTAAAARTGARLLPVDSEHSAVFQCLAGRGQDAAGLRRVILTASGGPFRDRPDLDLARVTVDEALAHPTWAMGPKVTIDSATMMNKGLELIEAHWLFGIGFDKLDVLVHPQSLVHGLVELRDGSVLAHLAPADMRHPIQFAMTYPERCDGGLGTLDLAAAGRLEFGAVDHARFPCLGLACEAGRRGGTLPAVLNAANEVAVERFLAGSLRFTEIAAVVEEALAAHDSVERPDLDAVWEADRWARETAAGLRKG